MKRQTGQTSKIVTAFSCLRYSVLVLIAICTVANSFSKTIETQRDEKAVEIKTEKYQGNFSTLHSDGYEPSNGATLKRTPSIAGDYFLRSYCKPYIRKLGFDCVWVIANLIDRQIDGRPIYKNGEMLRIKIPSGLTIMETDDSLCKSSKFPEAHILTIGSWRWRKPPLVGGYAHSIKKAWRIDLVAMQFREIPTSGVSCVINADRN